MKIRKWICEDATQNGDALISDKYSGEPIGVIYNEKDVNLIVSAPEMRKLLIEYKERGKFGGLSKGFDKAVNEILKKAE